MAITAKVLVNQKTENMLNTQLKIVADYAEGRNKSWADATPVLNMDITVNKEVAKLLNVGDRFTLTFTPDEE